MSRLIEGSEVVPETEVGWDNLQPVMLMALPRQRYRLQWLVKAHGRSCVVAVEGGIPRTGTAGSAGAWSAVFRERRNGRRYAVLMRFFNRREYDIQHACSRWWWFNGVLRGGSAAAAYAGQTTSMRRCHE